MKQITLLFLQGFIPLEPEDQILTLNRFQELVHKGILHDARGHGVFAIAGQWAKGKTDIVVLPSDVKFNKYYPVMTQLFTHVVWHDKHSL